MDSAAEITIPKKIEFSPKAIADTQAYFPVYLQALFNKNHPNLKGNQNHVGVEKPEFMFSAFDHALHYYADRTGLKLPEYGTDQSLANSLFIEIFSDYFNNVPNPDQIVNFIKQRQDRSLLSVYSYLLINPNCQIENVPEGYCTGIMPRKIIDMDKAIIEPSLDDLEQARFQLIEEQNPLANNSSNN